VGIEDAFLMGFAPLGKGADDELANIVCDFAVIFSGLIKN